MITPEKVKEIESYIPKRIWHERVFDTKYPRPSVGEVARKCGVDYQTALRILRPDKFADIREQRKKSQAKITPEKKAAYRKRCYQNHPDQARASSLNYYYTHRERYIRAMRERRAAAKL
jgi:hypothetical protein